jgi:hypothetical protein
MDRSDYKVAVKSYFKATVESEKADKRLDEQAISEADARWERAHSRMQMERLESRGIDWY